MPSKYRLLSAGALVAAVCLAVVFLTPLLVSAGLRLWISWKARSEKLNVKIDKIETPLFRPVMMRGIHIYTGTDAAVRFDATAEQVSLALNLQGILLRTRGRALHAVSIDGLHAEMHRNPGGTPVTESGWSTLQRLLPESFKLDRFDLRLENGASVFLLRSVSLTASQIETGRFQAGEVMIRSPLFRQTFSGVRGATNWQDDRLTIAGLALTRGLDAQSITVDFSHLGKRRMGIELDLDAFGGKIRASVSNEWRSHHPNWNLAGSAADISLSQTAEAIGFTDRVGGLLHAGKFTFRGDPADPLQATGSLWTELTGPAWREREADVIMMGVSLYNRQLDLQQLYVKQRKNQLTLSGRASFPTSASGWLHPEFNGNISASITDLGDFANLFGAARSDFAGQIAIEGVVNAHDRKIGGNLVANGSSLTMFKNSIDAFSAQVNLRPNEMELAQLELKRKNDVLHAQAKIDTSPAHNYSGVLDATTSNIWEYFAMFCPHTELKRTSANIHVVVSSGIWEARGTFDPAASSPIQFSAKFPLQIGSDWNAFLKSPVDVTLDFPSLVMAELPRCLSGVTFQNGILRGKLSISETPKNPHILGEAQLSGGRLSNAPINVSDVNGRITFQGQQAVIDSIDAVGPQGGLSLYGDIDFADTNAVAIHLFSRKPVTDLTPGVLNCVNRLEIGPAGSTDAPPVGEVEFRGGIFSDWRVLLKELPSAPSPSLLNWDFTAHQFSLCRSEGMAPVPLVLGVQPAEPAKRVRSRKHR